MSTLSSPATGAAMGRKAGTLVVVVMKAVNIPLFSGHLIAEKSSESTQDREARSILHCAIGPYGRTYQDR
jgi:hypothetical protein